jgi:O-methyltransferase
VNPVQRFGYSLSRLCVRPAERFIAPAALRAAMPFTMVPLRRLHNLQQLASRAVADGIDGAFVECGTWKGGSGALLAREAAKADPVRTTWFCDSYQGMPRPGRIDGWFAQLWTGHVQATPDDVRAAVTALGCALDHVRIEPGWFEETLAHLDTGPISLLHVDCDWFDSVTTCVECLYDRVVPGGFVVFDDYGYWPGCRQAVDAFRARRRIDARLIRVDRSGAYFTKPA